MVVEAGFAAVVCRDEHGKFLGVSAVVISGLTDATSLQAIACNEGLALAQDLQLQAIKVAFGLYGDGQESS